MTRLILVRHGETEWNRTERYQGHTDIELSTIGLWQAERLRDHLDGQRIDAVYSSDLKRAWRTAQIITSKRDLAVIPCKELREIDFGKLEGMTRDEIQRHYPNWGDMSPDVSPPGGESLNQFISRIKLFASQLVEPTVDKTILVVAHGGSLQVLIRILLKRDIEHQWWQMRLVNASITILEGCPGQMTLSLLSDTRHLEDYSLE